MIIQTLFTQGVRSSNREILNINTFTRTYHLFSSTVRKHLPLSSYHHDPSQRKQVLRYVSTPTSTTDTPSSTSGTVPPTRPEKTIPAKPPGSTVVKVRTRKSKGPNPPESYVQNKFLTAIRAMHEYLLKPADLETLFQYKTRSPYSEDENNLQTITVYRRGDVEKRAFEIWGSPERLHEEKLRRAKARQLEYEPLFSFKKSMKEYQKRLMILENAPMDTTQSESKSILAAGSGKVVVTAVLINAANAVVKMVGWFFTGSASLFSEAIHSIADTGNQLILTFGLWQSIKKPNPEHPYGYSNMTYISSLISGVGIFCFGAGLAWYHGITVLLHPQEVESIYWGLALLGGSLISEGVTLIMAIKEIRASARETGLGFWEYVGQGYQPNVNVVLLEDLAAVLGVTVAATAMGLSLYLQSPIPDAIGSLIIGTILGGVASFIIYSNSAALVGRSIHPNQIEAINNDLENDRMVRALYDIKATDMGSQSVMFKAEIDIDGREITRSYLERTDIQAILDETRKIDSIEAAEAFLLKHGENIVDRVGAEIDRIERNLRKKHPSLQHVDLEVL